MSKVGGKRNFGYGKSLAWAGKNALKDRYGNGHFATQAAHSARWERFAKFAKSEGVRDARELTRELVRSYATALAVQVETAAISVRYAQNLISTVNIVLETMRGDRQLRLSPARLVGQRVNVREGAPMALDRATVADRLAALERQGHVRVAAIARLARDLGLRFREASLLAARAAHRQAAERGEVVVTLGTKGGRGKEIARRVPVSLEARSSLARAAAVQLDGRNLVPAGMTFRQWRDHAYGIWRRSAGDSQLAGFHELRAAYACERYAAITKVPAPVVTGGRTVSRDVDRAARAILAQELGHGRVDVVAAYIGSAR